MDAPPVRDRAGAPASVQKLDMIASIEIKAAIALVRQQNARMKDADLPVAVARIFGFQRMKPAMRSLVLSLAN
jgi:hypothetical protein